MNRSKILALISIVFITSIALLAFSPESNTNTKEVFQYPSNNIQESKNTLMCSYGEECTTQLIEKKPVECTPYHPWAGATANCTYTNKDVEEISLVTDENNYIKGQFSDKRFHADYISHHYNGRYDRIYYSDLEFLENGSYLMITSNNFLTHYSGENKKLSSARLGDYIENEEVMKNSSVILRGVALDPNYEDNKQIYVYYYLKKDSAGASWSEMSKSKYFKLRVSRFEYRPGSDKVFLNEKRFFDLEGPRAHMGGGIDIGPDNKLYVTVGEGTKGERAQNLSNYRGKVLRINTDGSVPEKNPFDDSSIYSYGHRNPQSLSWHPATNNLYVSEHGPERYDEVNLVERGNNYGWPAYKCSKVRDGSKTQSEMKSPLKCYKEWSMGPSGGTFVDDKDHPWYGDLFMTGLRGNHVRSYSVENGELQEERIFFYSKDPVENNLTQRFRDVEYFNGSLYVVGDHQGMAKLTPVERESWIERIL